MSSPQPPFWEEWLSGDEDFDLRPRKSGKYKKPRASTPVEDDLFVFDEDDAIMKANSSGSLILEPGQPSCSKDVKCVPEEKYDFEGFDEPPTKAVTFGPTDVYVYSPERLPPQMLEPQPSGSLLERFSRHEVILQSLYFKENDNKSICISLL